MWRKGQNEGVSIWRFYLFILFSQVFLYGHAPLHSLLWAWPGNSLPHHQVSLWVLQQEVHLMWAPKMVLNLQNQGCCGSNCVWKNLINSCIQAKESHATLIPHCPLLLCLLNPHGCFLAAACVRCSWPAACCEDLTGRWCWTKAARLVRFNDWNPLSSILLIKYVFREFTQPQNHWQTVLWRCPLASCQ